MEAMVWNEFDPDTYYSGKASIPGTVMDMFGFKLGKWYCIIYLTALAVGFRLLALIFLRLFVTKLQ